MMDGEASKSIFRQKGCCVIIPTYNNCRTLGSVIEGCLKYCNDVWVINDGSTDETRAILDRYSNITVLHQPVNKGKGVALRRAFREAEQAGFVHAVTIDSDGQHDPKDLTGFAKALEETPGSMIIGARNMGQNSIPGTSKFGHKNSNFWFWVETGIEAEDTQSGYRLYPLKAVNKLVLFTWRYEFEIEVIVRLAWKGILVRFIPVVVYYPEDRVSHFRPLRDFTRVAILNTFLVLAAFLWFRPVMLFRMLRKKSLRQIWNDHIFRPDEPAWKKTLAVAIGIFCGIIPLWGLQTATAIGLAFVFRLNKALTVLASNISVPPMIPLVVYFSIMTGNLLFKGTWRVTLPAGFTPQAMGSDFLHYAVGAIVLAFFAGALGGLITWLLIKLGKRSRNL